MFEFTDLREPIARQARPPILVGASLGGATATSIPPPLRRGWVPSHVA